MVLIHFFKDKSSNTPYLIFLEDAGIVDELRYVYLTPLSNEECKLVYGNQIKDEMVCAAGNNNEGFCLVY